MFQVINANNDTVFAVYPDGVKVFVDPTAKGKVGGFAISGRTSTKGDEVEYMRVTPDSTRIYVNEDATKGKVGGFAISGRTSTKGIVNDYLFITEDSTRVFTKDTISGFSVRDNSKGQATSYMQLTPLNYFIRHESGQKIQFDILNPDMGKYNTFFGYEAGKYTESGYKNIFIGNKAGLNNVSGAWNLFLGNNAGYSSVNGLSNIFIGDQAGYNFANGVQNVFIGNEAGYSTSENVYNNLFVGNNTGRYNVSGNYNTYIGISAGYYTLGTGNTFVGNSSGFSNTSSKNTYIGSESGIYTSTGTKNVYIGYRSGYRSYGSGNVFIGNSSNNTNFSSVDYSNCVAIGDSVIVSGDNQVRLGNDNVTSLYCMGAYASTTSSAANLNVTTTGLIRRVSSSKRYKVDITPLEINTSEIYNLNPVSFTSVNDKTRHFGLIAEDVAKVIPELVEFAVEKEVVPESDSEEIIPESVQYPILSVLLLKEIQKHEQTIQEQQKLISNQEKELNDLKDKIDEILKMLENK